MKNEKRECYLCDSPDIINKSCLQCKRPYCLEDAHKLEPFFYCSECHLDTQVEDTTFTRVDSEYNAKTDSTKDVVHSCRQLIFSGMSWIDSGKFISQMSLDELKISIELMRAHVYHMESEISRKAIASFRERLIFSRGGQQVQPPKQRAQRVAKSAPEITEANILDMAKKVGLAKMLEILNK